MADSWTVNHFDAAACITAAEINRQMTKVYNAGDDLPKQWSAWERSEDPDATGYYDPPSWIICGSDNDAHKETLDTLVAPNGDPPSPLTEEWKDYFTQIQTTMEQFTKASIGAPGVSFATALSNGVTLYTPISSPNGGVFYDLTYDARTRRTSWQKIDLSGVVFKLQTVVNKVDHVARTGDTEDKKFTVQSLYADLNNPELINSVDTSGYIITDGAIALMRESSTFVEADIRNALSASTEVKGHLFATESLLWSAITTNIISGTVTAEKLEPAKATIIGLAKLTFPQIGDNAKNSVAQALLTMIQSPVYTKKYVLGKSKIPDVTPTTGPFTPTAIRFSRYPMSFTQGTDESRASLNWNIMCKKPDLPSTSLANAGSFDKYPIADGAVGAMYVSYRRLITDLIVKADALKNGFGLDSLKFTEDETNAQYTLNTDVDFTDGTTYTAKFSNGNTHIKPDSANNRILITFQLDDVQALRAYSSGGQYGGGQIEYEPHGDTYRVTWEGYITFSLNASEELEAHYTQTTPEFKKQDDQNIWLRILEDIVTLGLGELANALDLSDMKDGIKSAVNNDTGPILSGIRDCVELPGDAVFKFDSPHFVPLGLRVNLQYE